MYTTEEDLSISELIVDLSTEELVEEIERRTNKWKNHPPRISRKELVCRLGLQLWATNEQIFEEIKLLD